MTLPSWVNGLETNERPQDSDSPFFANRSIYEGTVKEVIYPDNPQNTTEDGRKITQYRVNINKLSRTNSVQTSNNAPLCVSADAFGSGDYIRNTYRADPGISESGRYPLGARVLVCFLDGRYDSGVILGGLDNYLSPPARNSSDGHYFEFQFNGTNFYVNNDGEAILNVNGATKADGDPSEARDSNNKGTTVSVLKDGTISVNSGSGSSVVIDSVSGNITVNANNDVHVNASNIYLGEGASESLVLGDVLHKALSQFAEQFIAILPQIFLPLPPPIATAAVTAFQTWKATFLDSKAILSKTNKTK
jgi:hypothetical protein